MSDVLQLSKKKLLPKFKLIAWLCCNSEYKQEVLIKIHRSFQRLLNGIQKPEDIYNTNTSAIPNMHNNLHWNDLFIETSVMYNTVRSITKTYSNTPILDLSKLINEIIFIIPLANNTTNDIIGFRMNYKTIKSLDSTDQHTSLKIIATLLQFLYKIVYYLNKHSDIIYNERKKSKS